MSIPNRRVFTSGLAACCALLFVATPSAAADEWQWSITPYLWGASLDLDVDVNERQLINGEVSFSDLIDKLDFAGQVHFEGQKSHAGFFLDAQFFDFNDDEKHYSVGPLPVTAKSDLEQWIVEFGGLWSPGGEVTGFALLGGGRLISIDNEIEYEVGAPVNQPGDTGFNETLYDVMLGARYVHRFGGDRWSFVVRGDVATGDTDFTWNALAMGGYTFEGTDKYTLLFGYRHMVIDFDDSEGRNGSTVEPEMTYSGPLIAFRIGF